MYPARGEDQHESHEARAHVQPKSPFERRPDAYVQCHFNDVVYRYMVLLSPPTTTLDVNLLTSGTSYGNVDVSGEHLSHPSHPRHNLDGPHEPAPPSGQKLANVVACFRIRSMSSAVALDVKVVPWS